MAIVERASGAVLTGGSSRRFGSDKAFVAVPPTGAPLVAVAFAALREAGTAEQFAVGGDADRLAALGIRSVPDPHPGSGPLGGVLTALATARFPIVVVLACDLPSVDAETVALVVAALHGSPDADAVVPVVDGVPQVLCAAYHRRSLGVLTSAFDAGERSVRRAIRGLAVAEVILPDPTRVADVDTPMDLDRYAAGIEDRSA